MQPGDLTLSSGDVMRRLAELEKAVLQLSSARRMESATIGAGGITVRGGEIRIQDATGTIDLAVLSSTGVEIAGDPLILPGSISTFAGPIGALPSGWLVCDGTAVSRTTYADLFTAIGTTWGVGDGSTTFNLPDLRDRVLIGAGTSYTVGATGGATSHIHTNPSTGSGGSHSHTNSATGSAGSHSHTNPSTGSGGSHNHTTGFPSSVQGTAVGATNVGDATHGHTVSSDGSHAHTVSSTGTEAAHTHSVSSTGTDSGHTHTVADTGSGTHLPPYAAVLPIIRY